jgi:hypothetical protein
VPTETTKWPSDLVDLAQTCPAFIQQVHRYIYISLSFSGSYGLLGDMAYVSTSGRTKVCGIAAVVCDHHRHLGSDACPATHRARDGQVLFPGIRNQLYGAWYVQLLSRIIAYFSIEPQQH